MGNHFRENEKQGRAQAPAKIEILEKGPYRVSGGVPLREQIIVKSDGNYHYKEGRTFGTGETYFLCRCGRSSTMPFCDGSHVKTGFDGTLTAETRPLEEQSGHIHGEGIVLSDAEHLCAFARFCHRGEKDVWELTRQSGDAAAKEEAIKAATDCPAGRLVIHDAKTGELLEPHYEQPDIVLLQDPARNCSGPLFVRGGIPLSAPDGTAYEVRNRMTLCRCGESANKPFCDARHVSIGFSDGKKDPAK